uniref:Capping protein regulator and myosin 1 linker 3 n=1 Tax=Ornithorhynchus anatinus TaxID=9258 RepID=A0A6I8PDE1_ORNAN
TETSPHLITAHLQNSIRRCLSQGALQQQHRVKLETKPKKFEERVLVLTAWRLHLFPLKIPAKVSVGGLGRGRHSGPTQQILVETERGSVSLWLPTAESVEQVTRHVSAALAKVRPGPGCLIRRGNPDTPEGPRDTSPNSETSTSTTHSVCGGFSETYAALCDYNGLCCREEVQWDVDTIYHAEDNREFNLLDFSHLESRDLALMVAALAYNQWFTKLSCRDLRLGSEVLDQVLHTLSKSGSLEELVLDNAGLKTDFAQKLAGVFGENGGCVLHALTLSHNPIDDKGLFSLSQQLLCFPPGLTKLCLAKTAISPRGLLALGQTFGANPAFASSLRHLDLSKNPGLLATDEANALYSFLAQPNALAHIDLAGTDCSIDLLLGALLHGCCSHLTYLNLARNSCSHRKGREAPPAFKQFFSSAYTLNHVNLAATRLPLEALSPQPPNPSPCPPQLRSAGAQILQEQLGAVSAVGSLDLSDNGFDSDLLTLVPALGKNKALKHLFLGKNFNVKAKTLEEILHKLVQLIQEEDCSLQSLSVADSRLKLRTSILVNALGSNTCLAKVDLSGNGMEDIGAKMLSKALQINSSLRTQATESPTSPRTILWDRNNTSALGFLDIARALESNHTLRFMSFPVSDISQAYRSAPERTEDVWQKIQWCLVRNNHSQTCPQEQAFRLQHGLVTSSAEQMLQRLCGRVQEEVRALRRCPLEPVQDELLYVRDLIKDAKNSRALFPSLYELGHVLASDGPVRQRLESVASEVSKAVDKELQVILESMVSLTQELCPVAMRVAEGHNKTLSNVAERVTVPRNFIRGVLLEQAGQDIQNKLDEVKLSVVTYLTNSIVDEILQELYHSHKSLARHLAQLRALSEAPGSGGPGQELSPRSREHEETTDDELGTSIDTMAIKKQKHCRRIRPVSAFISGSPQDAEGRPGGPGVPPAWFPAPGVGPPVPPGSWEGLMDLPTHGHKLLHQTAGRPRPPRTTAPGPSRPTMPGPGARQENGMATRLDEGLDDFFSRKVMAESASCPWTLRTMRPGPPDPPLQKKRRRGLFHFRRPRSLKGERGPGSPTPGMLPPPPPPPPRESPPTPDPPSPEGSITPCRTPEEEYGPLPGLVGARGFSFRRKLGAEPLGSALGSSSGPEAALLQPPRLQGIALPGLGRVKGWTFEGRRESADPPPEGTTHPCQRRRSSEDAGERTHLPPPPPTASPPPISYPHPPPPAEESAPSSRQSPSPALRDEDEEEEEGRPPLPPPPPPPERELPGWGGGRGRGSEQQGVRAGGWWGGRGSGGGRAGGEGAGGGGWVRAARCERLSLSVAEVYIPSA